MSEKGMYLHPKYGLAPTIPQCLYCGKDKNEIALLGRQWKGEGEPPHRMVIDYEPCDSCMKKIREEGYVGFFATECGHAGLIKRELLEQLVTQRMLDELGDSPVFGMEHCFSCLGVIPSVSDIQKMNDG